VKTTARRAASERPDDRRSPLSLTLHRDLRRRLASEAKKRNLKVATTARVLIDERIGELEDEAQLRRAEQWQLKQALATWKKIQAGDRRWVSLRQLEADARRALEEARSRARGRAS
jgi:hypothetical protein